MGGVRVAELGFGGGGFYLVSVLVVGEVAGVGEVVVEVGEAEGGGGVVVEEVEDIAVVGGMVVEVVPILVAVLTALVEGPGEDLLLAVVVGGGDVLQQPLLQLTLVQSSVPRDPSLTNHAVRIFLSVFLSSILFN